MATIMYGYARRCGLECSPTQSEFTHRRPNPKCTANIDLTLASGPIPEHDEVRVLGLFIHPDREIDTTLQKLRKTGDQVSRMVARYLTNGGRRRRYDLKTHSGWRIHS